MPRLFGRLVKTIGAAFGTKIHPMGGIDPTSLARGFRTTTEGDQRVIAEPYLIATAEGEIAGHAYKQIRARMVSVGTTSVLLSLGGHTEQAAAAQRSVVSTSASDSAAGTGVQQVEIDYIDGAGVAATEIVTMNGLTPVDTVATDIKHIRTLHAVRDGATGLAAGIISLMTTTAGGGTAFATIEVGESDWQTAYFCVDASKVLYISNIHVMSDDKGFYDLYWQHNLNGNLVWTHHRFHTDKQNQPMQGLIRVNGTLKICVQPDTIGAEYSIVVEGWEE